jgi:hypothetical protein
MFLLLFALGAVGLFAIGASRREPALEIVPRPRVPYVSGVSGASGAPRAVPSPLQALDWHVRAGLTPPPIVILCSIAEAQAAGRCDVAQAILHMFVVPVVAAHEQRAAALARATNPALASCAYPVSRALGDWDGTGYGAYGGQPPVDAEVVYDDPSGPGGPSYGQQPYPQPGYAADGVHPDIDQVRRAAALHAAQRVARGAVDGAGRGAQGTAQGGTTASEPRTLTVSGKSSPIEGVGTEAWGEFVDKIGRELPTYTAQQHVGRYRQRKDRLVELGIDPASIVASPDAQDAALDADMRDAYGHAMDSGLLGEYVGAAIQVPVPGVGARRAEVTASGVMGVIQAAGLEGAASWLENPADRSKYPHTTDQFLRCNGVF